MSLPSETVKELIVHGEPLVPSHSSKDGSSDERVATASAVDDRKPLGSSRALAGWLVLNFATGPTSSMLFTFLPAAIQTVANFVGTVPGTGEPCAAIGPIVCVVRFGSREVDYLTYLLYLTSITRGLQAVACIIVSGAADYSRFRKPMMMITIYIFGILSLPLAAITDLSYQTLTSLSALYCASLVVMVVFMVIQASYIPMFMATARLIPSVDPVSGEHGQRESPASWAKGARVSTWGIVVNNLGMILSVLVGVIIAHVGPPSPDASNRSYLLAMTVSGAVTIVVAIIGHWLLPGVPGKKRSANESIFSLPLRSCWRLANALSSHPEAFKFCAGWALWDAAWFNYNPIFSSLFLETTGIGFGAGAFTVFTLIGIIAASIGTLGWMYAFPRMKTLPIKSWLFALLGVNILCIFWGCLGISPHSAVGYKHPAEFWVSQVLFMSTNGALLAYNRVVFASFVPHGSEALFSGLIFMLDLCTGWVLPLIQARIQNHTHNLRYSMILSVAFMAASVPFFVWCRIDKGSREAGKMLLRPGSAAANGG